MVESIFLAMALTTSPQPAENYCAKISPEIASTIQEFVIVGEYKSYLDFNGDGVLTIADVVGVEKRYQDNITNGNEITIDREAVYSIIEENYSEDAIYWEFDSVNGEITRLYEVTVSEITEVNLYLEFESYSENIPIEVNPFTESFKVLN